MLAGMREYAYGYSDGALYRTLQPASRQVDLRLIPYYTWANRGVSYMTVWLPLAR
ncbi:MAG: hypothetical protein AAB225_03725 [Acidobacteriota bacterium]